MLREGIVMRLRCRGCGGLLGLGVQSVRVWVPQKWWFTTLRFCGPTCRRAYEKRKQEEKDDKEAVSALFHPP